MRMLLITLLLVPFTVSAMADQPPSRTGEAGARGAILRDAESTWTGAAKILARAAETMPEEHYDFRPVDSVRTFGQIVGHIADSQYLFCSAARGEKNPAPKSEVQKRSKAELLKALEDSTAYCRSVYAALTDASSVETIAFMGGKPRLGVLNVNSIHAIEHYGNLVTYLRMKNLVPPTSDPAFMRSLQEP